MRSIITLLLVSGCSVNSDSVGSSLPSIEELPGSVEAVAMGCRTTYFRDVDHDGFGDRRKAKIACSAPVGYVKVSGDCDDRDSLRNPNAAEVCDGIDQNCNGSADESAVDASTWYVDTDKDGHGDATISAQSCSAPSGYVAASDDCNDSDAATYVGAPETCDGRDNNCDNTVDNQPVDGAPAYVDADGDGFGLDTGAGAMVVCHLEPGFTGLAGDCNDADASISPSAPEICDLVDQNCNGIADDNAMGAPPWFADKDQDGHGDPATVVLSCSPPPTTWASKRRTIAMTATTPFSRALPKPATRLTRIATKFPTTTRLMAASSTQTLTRTVSEILSMRSWIAPCPPTPASTSLIAMTPTCCSLQWWTSPA